ncbi:hypothetical protein M0805_009106 [Coniferiporia weirii]|nr:hypothetical protein M0805_009106 [Coniferiporia weirii]
MTIRRLSVIMAGVRDRPDTAATRSNRRCELYGVSRAQRIELEPTGLVSRWTVPIWPIGIPTMNVAKAETRPSEQRSQTFDLPQNSPTTGDISASIAEHHDGTFYVTTTLVKDYELVGAIEEWYNMIFTTTDIFVNNGNGWFYLVHFAFLGDMNLFWDDDDTVYVQGSHYWRVYPAIQQMKLNIEICVWKLGHMVTMARTKDITGPYIPYANDPVLTNVNTTDYRYRRQLPMGRETVFVPVVWEENEFPVFNGATPGRTHVQMSGPLPPKKSPTILPTSGPLVDHTQKIDFLLDVPLPRQLVYYRYRYFSRFEVSPPGHEGTLSILGSAANITGGGGAGTSTFIARRQDALEFTATATLAFSSDPQDADEEDEDAGLTLLIQRVQHFDLGVVVLPDAGPVSRSGALKNVRLRTINVNAPADGMHERILAAWNCAQRDDVRILVRYGVWWGMDNRRVRRGARNEVSGGFTGSLVGMFATGNGKNSTTPAYFSDFIYDPVQGVYFK